MAYSRDFFALQLRFAGALTARFGLTIEDALFRYTPFALNFERESFDRDFQTAPDPLEWVLQRYEQKREAEVEADTFFRGHRLFGRFYFELRDGHVIRPHLAPVSPSKPVLGEAERAATKADLRRGFEYIHATLPNADLVAGNSWLYNLPAYRSLFPPRYTQQMSVSVEDEFHYLALWGQFFHRNWQLRENAARELLSRVEALKDLENLGRCFPLQILKPRCEIREFFSFYGVI